MIAKYQAWWLLDRQIVGYCGVELQISQISDLVISEYQNTHTLLYNKLLFCIKDLIPMEVWRLKDNLDLEDFGGFWFSHPSNSKLLENTDLALFQQIQGNAKLRDILLIIDSNRSIILYPKTIEIYKAQIQEFLKQVLVLYHILSDSLLQKPELLSVMWHNTAQQRHLFIWEKLVMIYTQYYKGQ